MRTVDAPPVVDEHVEDTQNDDKERRRPLGLETNRNHRAGGKTNKRDQRTPNAPFASERETDEQEDEEDTACQQEARAPLSG